MLVDIVKQIVESPEKFKRTDEDEELHWCNTCKTSQPINHFYSKPNNGGPQRRCIACLKEVYYLTKEQEYKEQGKEYKRPTTQFIPHQVEYPNDN